MIKCTEDGSTDKFRNRSTNKKYVRFLKVIKYVYNLKSRTWKRVTKVCYISVYVCIYI